MKLLYTIILLLATIQLSRAKPLNSSISSNTLTVGEQLARDYDDQYHLLAQEISVKIKNINEEILKNDQVKQSTSPLMKKLKKNMTHFEEIYVFYKRFGFDTKLVKDFSNMVSAYYNLKPNPNREAIYIYQLLKKLGYDEIRYKNKSEFKKFLNEKLLTKAEELKTQLSRTANVNETEAKVLEWMAVLKQCQEYECFLVDFQTYKKQTSNIFIRIFGDVFEQVLDLLIIFSHNQTKFAQDVLKDPKLLQLSEPIRQQLMQNLRDIIKIHDTVAEPQQLYLLPGIYYIVLFKFDNYANISLQERQLITNVFDDHHFTLFPFYDKKPDRRMENDYLKEFENKMASLSPTQHKLFFEEIESLRNSSSREESSAFWNRIQSVLH